MERSSLNLIGTVRNNEYVGFIMVIYYGVLLSKIPSGDKEYGMG